MKLSAYLLNSHHQNSNGVIHFPVKQLQLLFKLMLLYCSVGGMMTSVSKKCM